MTFTRVDSPPGSALRFAQCLLGTGVLASNLSLVLRPCWHGYRLFINTAPCPVLPFGG